MPARCPLLQKEPPFVMVFCKRPAPGRVKTRLAKSIGAMRAAALYRAFVQDVLTSVRGAGALLRCCPAPSPHAIREDWPPPFWWQHGADLGKRMSNAFARAFAPVSAGGAGAAAALLVGTDVPQISPWAVRSAWRALMHADLTFGPALDGGYYLVGMRREAFSPHLFEKIAWSGPHVLNHSLQRAAGLHTVFAPCLRDVDDLADLQALLQETRNTMPATRRAARVLHIPPQ